MQPFLRFTRSGRSRSRRSQIIRNSATERSRSSNSRAPLFRKSGFLRQYSAKKRFAEMSPSSNTVRYRQQRLHREYCGAFVRRERSDFHHVDTDDLPRRADRAQDALELVGGEALSIDDSDVDADIVRNIGRQRLCQHHRTERADALEPVPAGPIMASHSCCRHTSEADLVNALDELELVEHEREDIAVIETAGLDVAEVGLSIQMDDTEPFVRERPQDGISDRMIAAHHDGTG